MDVPDSAAGAAEPGTGERPIYFIFAWNNGGPGYEGRGWSFLDDTAETIEEACAKADALVSDPTRTHITEAWVSASDCEPDDPAYYVRRRTPETRR